jgi:CDP-diacylglycerol--serine O-phosphatidyltransferase
LNVHYFSFKDMDFKNRVPFFVILMVILLFVIVSWDPPVVLFVIAIIYALSGPVLTFYQYRKKKSKKVDAIDEGAS